LSGVNGKVVVVTGPTAAGKTGLGIALAQELNGEVVSADSMQVYRGMDIGTAKPAVAEMAGVRHHMLDIVDPHEVYSVARYAAEAAACADDILARGRLPIIVGGTGLYIDSLLSGRYFAENCLADGDSGSLRGELLARYDREGGEVLWRELGAVDPESAARLHPNDKKRVVRALEVFRLTGETITAHNLATRAVPPRYEALKIALTAADRGDLYRRIDRRVDVMMAEGLFAEVAGLIKGGLSAESTAMQAIGYKEMVQAVSGVISVEEAVERVKQESRRYAKRQLSWLRRDASVRWIYWEKAPDFQEALQVSTEFCRGAGIL